MNNNIDTLLAFTQGSYDPNDKLAKDTISVSNFAKNQTIDFTIRFQNTGTDTAFNVVVADTLSSDLNPSSLQILATSHSCMTVIEGNKVYFKFNNINLVDSLRNEKKSHGFVKFSVKALATLPQGSTIRNTAAIYFDFNAPVITNTTKTVIADRKKPILTSSPATIYLQPISFAPNPAKDQITLNMPAGSSIEIYNLSGLFVKKHTLSSENETISLSGISKGVYIIKSKGMLPSKLVVE